MKVKILCVNIILLIGIYLIETKSNLTLEKFFDYRSYRSVSLSPSGKNILIQIEYPL